MCLIEAFFDRCPVNDASIRFTGAVKLIFISQPCYSFIVALNKSANKSRLYYRDSRFKVLIMSGSSLEENK